MHSLVCEHCRKENRVSKPVLVPYMPLRSQERSFTWVCSYHDSVDCWPVYKRTSPPIPQE